MEFSGEQKWKVYFTCTLLVLGSSEFLMGESSLLGIAIERSNHGIRFDTDADCDTDNKDQYSCIKFR